MINSLLMTKLLVPEVDNQTALTASVVNRGNILGSIFLGITKRNEIDASKGEAARIVENLKGFIDGLEGESPTPADETNTVVVSILRSVSSEKIKQMEDYVKTKYPDPHPGGRIIKGWIDSSKGLSERQRMPSRRK